MEITVKKKKKNNTMLTKIFNTFKTYLPITTNW